MRIDLQIGLEQTPEDYVNELVGVFREIRRVIRIDATVWLNLGDSYASTTKGTGGGAERSGLQRDGRSEGVRLAGAERANAWVEPRRFNIVALKVKDLIGIPWRVAFALQADGWWLRSAIIWAKPNGMPGSQDDRCTQSYETVFMLSRSAHYWSDFDAIKTPPRESTMVRTAQDVQAQAGSHRANGGAKTNGTVKAVGGLTGSPDGRHGDAIPERERRYKQRGHSRRHEGFNERWDAMSRDERQARPAMMRDVWFVSPASYSEAHFAVMPEEVARRCILAGCPEGGTVLDPFGGAGTTGLVADRLGRNCIGIELNPAYAAMARNRLRGDGGMFSAVDVEDAR